MENDSTISCFNLNKEEEEIQILNKFYATKWNSNRMFLQPLKNSNCLHKWFKKCGVICLKDTHLEINVAKIIYFEKRILEAFEKNLMVLKFFENLK